jgi:hypothetical protein
MQRTKALGLLHKTIKKDGRLVDIVLVTRPQDAQTQFDNYKKGGNRPLTKENTKLVKDGSRYILLDDKNSPIIKHSQENKGLLYILDVNMLKDQVASNMALVCGTDGTQPSGFMNFPQPSGGKYNLKSYFSHYESEVRIAKIQNGQEVGFIWKKKREDNHFWDICNYGLASREVFIADLKRQEPKNRDLNWISFCDMVNS